VVVDDRSTDGSTDDLPCRVIRHDGFPEGRFERARMALVSRLAVELLRTHDAVIFTDADEPVLGQRRFAKLVGRICKPSLKRVGAPWVRASHGIRAPYVPDRGLLMVHLKFADLDLVRRTADLRHAVRASSGLTERSAWAKSGDEIVAEFRSFLDGGPEVPEFDAQRVDPHRLVAERDGVWLAKGARQLCVMARGALLRVPSRYHGMV